MLANPSGSVASLASYLVGFFMLGARMLRIFLAFLVKSFHKAGNADLIMSEIYTVTSQMEYLPVKAVTREEAMGEPPTPHLHELKVSSGHQEVLKWGLSTISAGSHSANSPQLWSKPPEMPRPELTP